MQARKQEHSFNVSVITLRAEKGDGRE